MYFSTEINYKKLKFLFKKSINSINIKQEKRRQQQQHQIAPQQMPKQIGKEQPQSHQQRQTLQQVSQHPIPQQKMPEQNLQQQNTSQANQPNQPVTNKGNWKIAFIFYLSISSVIIILKKVELESTKELEDPYIGLFLYDRYKINKKLGEGVYGWVYLVDDTKTDIR